MIDLLKTHLQNKEADQIISLIEKDASVLAQKDEKGSSVFMMIAYSGLPEVFERAVALKEAFSFPEAVISGKIEILQAYLAKAETDIVNTHSDDGFTPLSLAAFFKQTEIAKWLVEQGADPNVAATNPAKVNALHAAIAKENYELSAFLIEHGADVNAPQMQNVGPLHSAVHRGNLELTKLLVENGASITSAMENGDTPLSIARREEQNEIAAYLESMINI